MSALGPPPWASTQLPAVEEALSQWVPGSATDDLAQAMQHAVLGGGKRLRPLLVLATAEAVSGNELRTLGRTEREGLLRCAVAVELIHAYSLVHDDMPCMDNDVLRRGQPTVHVKFGEAVALLAGDALQTLAFELLAGADASWPAATRLHWVQTLATAAGAGGMCGGQAIDLAHVGQAMTQPALEHMHALKTGALLHASVMLGAMAGGASALQLEHLSHFGRRLGLAFQVVDDVLDVTADTATLGKTAGKDEQHNKPTYVALLGLDKAQRYAEQVTDEALRALRASACAAPEALQGLAQWVTRRQH
jgi:farnesyl diphosphate synthase